LDEGRGWPDFFIVQVECSAIKMVLGGGEGPVCGYKVEKLSNFESLDAKLVKRLMVVFRQLQW
jgi:hypothetical protein